MTEIVQKNSVIEKITFDAMNNDIKLNIFLNHHFIFFY